MPAVRKILRQNTIVAAIALTWLAGPQSSFADLSDHQDYRDAKLALSDQLPLVAAVRLNDLLASPEIKLSKAERQQVGLLRLEAFVRGRDYTQALAGDPLLDKSNAEVRFWLALAEAGMGHLSNAAAHLAALEQTAGFAYRDEARLTRAHLLQQLGDDSDALKILDTMVEEKSPAATHARLEAARIHLINGDADRASPYIDGDDSTAAGYLRGWIALHQNAAESALAAFSALLDTPSEQLSRAIYDGTRFGQAKAHLLAGRLPAARDAIFTLLDNASGSPLAEPAMRLLAGAEFAGDPTVRQKIDQWRSDVEAEHRSGIAAYISALIELRDDAGKVALDTLKQFLKDHPNHELELSARLLLAELMINEGDLDDAKKLIAETGTLTAHPAILNQLDYLRGIAKFDGGDLNGAIVEFRKANRLEREYRARSGTFNIALARLHADLDVSVDELLEAHGNTLGREESSAELLLERGLYLARQGDGTAFEALGEYIRRFGDHRRAADAELALAELHLNQIPPKPVSAREHIDSAKKRELTIDQREQLDHVAIWVEESAGDDQLVVQLAERFLDQWPVSDLRPSVLMKLGETHYRLRQYSLASEAFTRLTTEAPNSAYTPAAQFFAAKAAGRSLEPEEQERAIGLWQKVVASNSAFASAARHEEGLLHMKLDDVDEAIKCFGEVLEMQPPPDDELRFAALCDAGQAWFTKSSADVTGDADFSSAISAFDAVLKDEAAPLEWRAQAAVRKGKCLEVIGQTTEALALYHEIMSAQDEPVISNTTPQALDWYYRAGFASIRLLEREKNWRGAVAIASRLGRRVGPRSVEAENLADKLRLEHFIWDE